MRLVFDRVMQLPAERTDEVDAQRPHVRAEADRDLLHGQPREGALDTSASASVSCTRRASGPASTNTPKRVVTSLSCTEPRSEEHTSELQSLMRISYAVFCLNKKKNI